MNLDYGHLYTIMQIYRNFIYSKITIYVFTLANVRLVITP